eukprot:TRINITY_DN13042_c0_g1_i1.p1 TRINITY_DN13042_c0_g1~~TRINITY_DN13042_c0_g1_i1.p1  ORF type:complete len:1677 (-),score=602.43 TRINITY_DN13042_c0_g1_i1:383-5413(-)
MASQEGRTGAGAGSPLGPDSTWGEAEFSASKMEARFVQLEAKLLKDQDEKYNKLMEAIQGHVSNPDSPGIHSDQVGAKIGELQEIIEQKCLPCIEKMVPVMDIVEKSVDLVKTMEEIKSKIEMLLGGENEANKLIDSIAPNVEKVKADVKKLEQCHKDVIHKIDKVYDEAKKVRDEQKSDHKMLEDIQHLSKRIREEQTEKYKKMETKLDELKNSSKRSATSDRKRGRSGSDSSGNGSRNRHSRSRSRKRRASRENSISSLQAITRNKEHEFEKLLMQINGSLELQRESIEKLNNGSLNVLEEQIMPNIHTIRKLVEAGNIGPVTIPASKWEGEDDDRSPSPPHRTSRSPHKLANKLGLDSASRGREEKGKKKKKAKSASRSSSSSSEDRSSSRSGKKDIMRNMQVMVTTVAGIEEKVKELMKGNKKSNAKVEENCKQVLDRVGEMTVGVQVIAENLDSVNDVARKMEILDHIETSLTKLGRLDEISQIRVVLEKLRSDKEETGWGEPSRINRGIGHDEVRELVKQMDIDQKFCEFGGLVEELSSKIDKKLDRVSGDRDKESDEMIEMLKRLKRLETLSGALSDNSLKTWKTVQSIDKRSGGELLPAVQELLRIGGVTTGPPKAPPHSPAGSFTPPHPPPSVTDSPGGGGGGGALSDYRMAQLDRKIGEILPKLDDMYIKVLPCLDEIKQRQRKESEKENLTVNEVKECAVKVEKIMDMVEDLVEARNERAPGSLDRRINSSMELEGVMNKFGVVEGLISRQQSTVGECLNALVEMRTFTAKQGTLDRIERLLVQRDEAPLSGVPGEDTGRLDRKITTALEFLKKEEKTLEMFMKNSMSDAKLLSQCNTSIQGMKAAVSGNGKEVLLAVQAVGDQLRGVEGLVGEVKGDLVGLGGSLDEIGGQVRSMDRDSNTTCSGAEVVSKLQTSVERLTSNVKSLEKASRSGGSSSVKQERDATPVGDDLGGNYSDLKSQLDDLHDMVAQSEETLTTGLTGVKQEVNKHDQNIGFAVNNLAKLLKAAVDSFKKLPGDLAETENRIKKCCEEATTEMLEHVDSSTEKIIKEAIESSKDNSSASDGASPEMGGKLDIVVNKLDKLSKIVGRIKYLVEDESDDEDESKKKKRAGGGGEMVKMDTAEIEKQLLDVSRKIDLTGLESRLEVLGDKMDKMDKDTSEKKVEELILKFDQLEENISRRIEDDLSGNSEKVDRTKQLVMEIKNVVTEVGDRMVTKRGFESGQEEVRQRLTKMASGIDSIPDEFGSQAAAMEENLCVNVVGSVKDVFKQHWEDLMNEVDQILGKLATIKRYVKFGVKEGQEEGEEGEQTTLETVMEKINKVAEKLGHVQAALETDVVGSDGVDAAGPALGSPREKLGTALLLTEIRKRADSESVARLRQEMFTAVHNVQRRLLEEQVRLVTKLGESRQEAPQANIITLIECLNKVRESQAHISAGQESGILAQAETNRLLGVVVNNLEQAHNLLDSDSDGTLPQRITSRLAEICDDLGAAVTGLVTAQDQMGSCGTSNMEQLDRLIKSASNIMREDALPLSATGRKRMSASEGGPVGKKRGVVGGIRSLRRDVVEESGSVGSGAASCSPMSEGGGGDGVEPNEGDWDPPVLRQPSVLVRQAVLTPRQRAELRKFSKDEEKDEKDNAVNEIEIKDEFASPEKGEGGSRTRTDRV